MSRYEKKSIWRETIASKLKKKSGDVWKDVAWRITRPRQNLAEVNLDKLDKITSNNDTVVVPGKVLGNGEINHKITIAALSFSYRAKMKIKEKGGKYLTLLDLAEEKPDGKGIKIIG